MADPSGPTVMEVDDNNKNVMASIIPINQPAVATFSLGCMMGLSKNKYFFNISSNIKY